MGFIDGLPVYLTILVVPYEIFGTMVALVFLSGTVAAWTLWWKLVLQ